MTTLTLASGYSAPANTIGAVVAFTGEAPDGLTINGDGLTAVSDITVQVTANIEWRASSDLGGASLSTGYRVVSIARDLTTVQSELDDSHNQFEVVRQSVAATVELAAGETLTVRAGHDYSKPIPLIRGSLIVVQVPDSSDDIGADPAGSAAAVLALSEQGDAAQDELIGSQATQISELQTGLADVLTQITALTAMVAALDAEPDQPGFYTVGPVAQQPKLTPPVTSGVDVVTVLGVSVLGGSAAGQVNNHTKRINELEARLTTYGLLPV